jgi:hypothetical protein
MTEKLKDYYETGLLGPTFQVERNLLIWQHIADEVPFLNTQPKHVQDLYSFMQTSARNNIVLNLGLLFDKKKKYETKCIESFLELVKANASASVKIVEDTGTIALLRQFNCPPAMEESIRAKSFGLFPTLYSDYYSSRLRDQSIIADVNEIKAVRDKFIAHNEASFDRTFDLNVAHRLCAFVSEIFSIYGMAYHATIWQSDTHSMLNESAKRNAYFIKTNISKLKN